ncbi:tyrosine-type recombinase/integrase [Colwellia ponticola]|uniref:Site-specific integrase n=1 Tax=Colwellia ponticola TaxID=2304625 RepID=A0A8H2PLK2_9GAMM|nr:tyrosine-type recombinase/integrase [Colwellia ponticola]TMM47056.1 site-specific integrase [Colwellia ponticola]
MAKLSARKDTNKLYFDFSFDGRRCREKTNLIDTKINRRRLQKKLDQINAELLTGQFSYLGHFPSSKVALKLEQTEADKYDVTDMPLFVDFIDEWFAESIVKWRPSHLRNMLSMKNKYYLPSFSERTIDSITRADLLKFRTSLAKEPGRNGRLTLSNNRINKIMDPLRRVFEEAADRFDFNTPFVRIKPLKIEKTDVNPFSFEEVKKIVDKVRPDYSRYYLVRFLTGMRTGEVDGLKWKYVDFTNRLIKIRETIVAGTCDYTKNDFSQREISMSEPVFNALQEQHAASAGLSDYVFCNQTGSPVDHNNVTKRIWYPLLKRLGLEKRRPYQTRHTAATLWLASGESPEWIARQMGHSNTQMLFQVYSRFVPNLTRQDGSAFEKLLKNTFIECNSELDIKVAIKLGGECDE